MTAKDLKFFTIACTLILFTCAYRDNSYDPSSPLFRPDSPVLKVSLEFDSAQIVSFQNDTMYAYTPFEITVTASSKGGYDHNTDLQVFYRHYINGKQQEMNIINNPINVTLNDSGVHLLQFESSDNNGTEPTVEQKIILLNHKTPPKILSFKSDNYTLPINQQVLVSFTTNIMDSNTLLNQIIYMTPENVIRPVMNHSASLSDTFQFPFFEIDTGSKLITIKTVDIFKRVDSMSLILRFEDQLKPKNPPHINYISYFPREIKVMQEVFFMVNVTTTSTIVEKRWFFGEPGKQYWTADSSNRFTSPGMFTVKVKVTDDSGSSSIDSIDVNVFPSFNIAPTILHIKAEPLSGNAPLTVEFSAPAIDSDGVVTGYRWIMSGTGFETFDDSDFTFTYWYPGEYPVTVIAYDINWGSDTISEIITVTGEQTGKPILAAYPVPADIYQDIYFKLENAPAEHDSVKYIWEFPGKILETSEPKIRNNFKFAGDYTVKLIVKNGTIQSFTVPVKILDSRFGSK